VRSLPELLEERSFACRLTPDRTLAGLEEAEEFVRERGIVTGTADCSLPSLHTAIHEEPYRPGGRGFAAYPKTKWWWAGALAQQPDVHDLKIHRGKGVLVSGEVAARADPLAREELSRAERGEYGEDAARLVVHLSSAGPSAVDDLRDELGLQAKALRAARDRLERVGAVVSKGLRLEAAEGGHRHSSELWRWDQLFPQASGQGGLADLLVTGVRAAVVAPEREVASWFSWRADRQLLEQLVAHGRLARPEEGWLCLP
jgi:hypothetical protein